MPNIPELKSKIIGFIQRNGPSIPVQISKQVNENMILTGAVLSELASTKRIMISYAKIGSSPVYYLPGQEYKLSNIIYPYLKDVYKRVHDLLKKEIILRDKDIEPWQRVALRESRDFAIMLTLHNGDIFWRWYLTKDEDAEILIKKYLGVGLSEIRTESELKEEKLNEKTLDVFEKKEIPVLKANEKDLEVVDETIQRITGMKSGTRIEQLKPKIKPPKQKLTEKEKEVKTNEKQQQLSWPHLDKVKLFLKQKEISIYNEKIIDKKEINLTGEMFSSIGSVHVFIKFKDKKKVSDSDLITAHNESKTLPLYFLSTGDMTKKAKKYMEDHFLIFEKLK